MMKKFLSSLLALVMMFCVMAQPAFATQEETTLDNGLEMIEQKFTDTSIYAKYYLTTNGETVMYTEYSTMVGGKFTLDYTSVKVDENMEPIPSTETKDHYVETVASVDNEQDRLMVCGKSNSDCEYKPYTHTYSFSAEKWTLSFVAKAIMAVTGIAYGNAGVIAGVLIDAVSSGLLDQIPNSVYFDGERCVHQAVGKIYYRYRGNYYADSSKSILLDENVSWSRRWGH